MQKAGLSLTALAGLCLLYTDAYPGDTRSPKPDAHTAPNIILIVADNQSPSLLGTYGNPTIRTPNIDRLAREGMTFSNAYAVSGVCSPTRAALLTALMPSQTGVHNALPTAPEKIGIEDWSAIEEFRTLPMTLAAAGYTTALIGKYHLGGHDKPQIGFDHWVTMPTGHTKSFLDAAVINNGKRELADGHITDYWTDRAVEFINEQADDKPFFLMLAYNGPYMLPPVVTGPSQNRHAAEYRLDTPDFPQEPVHAFLQNWAMSGSASEHMRREATHAWAAIGALNNRQAMINTAAETAMVDDGVGRVLETVRNRGIDDNTLVIYTSDQGTAYGQHGLWGNTSWAFPFPAYDSHLRIPLIISHPGAVSRGSKSDALVSQLDLFPTILDHIGLDNVEISGSPGHSIGALLSGQSVYQDNPVFFEFITVRGIRTTNWKYVRRFPVGPDELYFIREDPDEINNLIADARYEDIREAHDELLSSYFEEYSDPKYDLWNGGTGKGRLLEDYGQNSIFEDRFQNWQPPSIDKAIPFTGD